MIDGLILWVLEQFIFHWRRSEALSVNPTVLTVMLPARMAGYPQKTDGLKFLIVLLFF